MTRRRLLVACALALALPAPAGAVLRPPTMLRVAPPEPGTSGAQFGASVAGIGDVNGDGVADLVAGAPGADRAYILSGATRTLLHELVDPEGTTGYLFGRTVAGVGDVDADGRQDVAVGAPGAPGVLPIPCLEDCPPVEPAMGRALLFSGATGAFIRQLVPVGDHLQFGLGIAGIGDVSGDGVPDVAVSAPALKQGRGTVFAFSGATGTQLWSTVEPSAAEEPIASFGAILAAVGDLNSDGRRDLLAAAMFSSYPTPSGDELAGRVYVLSGSTGTLVRTLTDTSPHGNDAFGGWSSGVGDQTGDGVEDHLVGERGANALHLYSGATGVLVRSFASPTDTQDTGLLSIAHVDDKTGDGLDDAWVGVRTAGAAYLMDLSGSVHATAAGPSEGFASWLAPIGDIGGDPGTDVIAGHPDESPSGAAYLVHTRPNVPPVADAGPDAAAECAGPAGSDVTLDGTGSSDADGDELQFAWRDESSTLLASTPVASLTLPLGVHTLTLTVTDTFGDSDTDEVTVVVQDTVSPSLSVSVSPSELSPPNHKLAEISATVQASDGCDPAPAVALASVTSNEADDGLGDGDTPSDVQDAATGTDDRAFRLRAERSGHGTGRVYTVAYGVTDGSSNTASATATVSVPKR